MVEVELKARVADVGAVAARVGAFARYGGELLKEDAYWHGPGWREDRGGRGFRIRREGGASVVTWKAKRREGGVEINREREFALPDPEAFIEFVQRLGCEPFYSKRKRGRRWTLDRPGGGVLLIELLEVAGLGHFLEIEALLPEAEPGAVELARAELHDCLSRAGLPESSLESRTYSELLAAAGLAQG